MDSYCICVLLCIVQRFAVNGQMLVSHKEDVIYTAISQNDPNDTWDIYHVVDSNVAINTEHCKCCGATQIEESPWFKLDLRKEYNIQQIYVIGRQDTYQSLYKMEIQLGTRKEDGTVLQGVDTTDTNLRELNYTLPSPELARYITITLRDVTQYLVICELYVYAECQTGTYGYNCIQHCGMCLDGDICDTYTGECRRGCADGYKGSKCSQVLNQDTLPCSPCSPCSDNICISIPVFIGSLFAVIVINTTSVYLWMRYRNEHHKQTQKAATNAATSIEQPNKPSNYDMLMFDNPGEGSR